MTDVIFVPNSVETNAVTPETLEEDNTPEQKIEQLQEIVATLAQLVQELIALVELKTGRL